MKERFENAKKFVKDNKNTIVGVTVTATICGLVIVAQNAGIKSLNNFLEEKDLLKEYYPDLGEA